MWEWFCWSFTAIEWNQVDTDKHWGDVVGLFPPHALPRLQYLQVRNQAGKIQVLPHSHLLCAILPDRAATSHMVHTHMVRHQDGGEAVRGRSTDLRCRQLHWQYWNRRQVSDLLGADPRCAAGKHHARAVHHDQDHSPSAAEKYWNLPQLHNKFTNEWRGLPVAADAVGDQHSEQHTVDFPFHQVSPQCGTEGVPVGKGVQVVTDSAHWRSRLFGGTLCYLHRHLLSYTIASLQHYYMRVVWVGRRAARNHAHPSDLYHTKVLQDRPVERD